jgi:hypothetical protein
MTELYARPWLVVKRCVDKTRYNAFATFLCVGWVPRSTPEATPDAADACPFGVILASRSSSLSIASRVFAVRASASAAVKPFVGIGGSTINTSVISSKALHSSLN